MNETSVGEQSAENQSGLSPSAASEQVAIVYRQAVWSGPLPPPEILQQYDAVAPGAANRILVMAENRQQNRIEMDKAASAREDKILDGDISQSKRGLWFAFISALLIIGIGTFLILLDKEVLGLAVILTPLATLAGVFVYATETRKAERRRNASDRLEE